MRDEDLQTCLRVLAELAEAPPDDPGLARVRDAVAAFTKRRRGHDRSAARRRQAEADAALLASTATGAPTRREGAPLGSALPVAHRPLGNLRNCYACGANFREVDAFYHRLCPPCADEHRLRRAARTDLSGRRALVTGGRVKAGFELVLKLLRDGAAVTAMTRFPRDARARFAAVPDHRDWWDRLTVTGIDLRDIPALVRWCDARVASGEPLDILVNLAAQTVRRPPESYAALVAAEEAPALAAGPAFPESEALDVAGLLPDPSPVNSWTSLVHEVDPVELLEVQLINVTAPFLLLGRLRTLLERSAHPRRYVVNVSAVEGQFGRRYKGAEHPHTNMAKAALNMLTRTGADELAASGVFMTSVDPGWFTDQRPEPDRERRTAAGFRPPLDVVDAAARVYDPIVRGEAGEPMHGCFLKDYRVTSW
ncbi:hypothetical protein [Spirillospora sp. CA-294931]|uniref:hypothetical protein n=1 Tax=Spirillospora sp. CA-294931 TaxID=3240042 RepID=UPI003D8E4FC2